MTDLERIIEARERDVADIAVCTQGPPCKSCRLRRGRLAALGPDSVALARAVLEEHNNVGMCMHDRKADCPTHQALLAWAQAGAQPAQGTGASGVGEDTQKAP